MKLLLSSGFKLDEYSGYRLFHAVLSLRIASDPNSYKALQNTHTPIVTYFRARQDLTTFLFSWPSLFLVSLIFESE